MARTFRRKQGDLQYGLRDGVQCDIDRYGSRRPAARRRSIPRSVDVRGRRDRRAWGNSLVVGRPRAGCQTANGDHLVEAAHELMLDFMLGN
ncbi:MAG: hypothetical protein H7Z42_02010 [Roseiflexaceae bacterium]|nr:hypothetical protein [Roseiflexaceae bacterium]